MPSWTPVCKFNQNGLSCWMKRLIRCLNKCIKSTISQLCATHSISLNSPSGSHEIITPYQRHYFFPMLNRASILFLYLILCLYTPRSFSFLCVSCSSAAVFFWLSEEVWAGWRNYAHANGHQALCTHVCWPSDRDGSHWCKLLRLFIRVQMLCLAVLLAGI